MSKVKKEESLMDKVEEIIKPLKEIFDKEPQTKTTREAPKGLSSGDKLLDDVLKSALRKGKFKK